MDKLSCEQCGKTFKAFPSAKRKYCSRGCWYTYNSLRENTIFKSRKAEYYREYMKIYRKKNSKKIQNQRKEWNKKYYAENREVIREKQAEYRIKNFDKILEQKHTWRKDNQELHRKRVLQYSHNRRAKVRKVKSIAIDRDLIYERDKGICVICDKNIELNFRWPHPKSVSLQHYIPISKGGENTPENVGVAHLRCNLKQGSAIQERGVMAC